MSEKSVLFQVPAFIRFNYTGKVPPTQEQMAEWAQHAVSIDFDTDHYGDGPGDAECCGAEIVWDSPNIKNLVAAAKDALEFFVECNCGNKCEGTCTHAELKRALKAMK